MKTLMCAFVIISSSIHPPLKPTIKPGYYCCCCSCCFDVSLVIDFLGVAAQSGSGGCCLGWCSF